ncbi:dynamin family protein [Catenuloplanes japonicus]|uniref:dynamin family protein n=1 Tax=Catenuloplanes japonicus TaxID=33876 RepID=UPI000526C190|nr:dynamin family protein [Catenuloplanes japonicus]
MSTVATPMWVDILDSAAQACLVHGRTDLATGLRARRKQLLDPALWVIVLGEPGQGKSQLINALINAPVCPVGDAGTTGTPTVVRHAEQPGVTLVHRTARTTLTVAEAAPHIRGREAIRAEIGVPRALLAGGLTLVDTPAAVPGEPWHARLGAHPPADTVVLASAATAELTVAELDLLRDAAATVPNVVVALTKTDLATDWRAVADRNRQRLASAGIAAVVIPVSAVLRLHAARTGDAVLNAESGFPELIVRLNRDVAGKPRELARSAAAQASRAALEQVAAPLRARLTSASAPSQAMARLTEAQRALDDVRRRHVRWQNTLNDDISDLVSNIEYDLRDRTRQILRRVDETFESADPMTAWDEFAGWLDAELKDAAEANFGWLIAQCEWISHRVAAHFGEYGPDALPTWRMHVPDDLDRLVPAIEQPGVEKFTITQKALTGLRGSYGGILMVGLATSLAGMPLINPVSVGAGAILGGKTVHDESKTLLKRRQSAARTRTQRHVDDFFLLVSKEAKDTVRQAHRLLRDHFIDLTDRLQDAIVHSVRTAKLAADADVAETERRQREIEISLRELAGLYRQAQQLQAA